MTDKKPFRNSFTFSTFLHNRKRKDGSHYIMYRVFLNSKRFVFSSGHTTAPSYWNESKGKVNSKHPDELKINADLAGKLKLVTKEIHRADLDEKPMDPAALSDLFGKEKQKAKPSGIIAFVDELVGEMIATNNLKKLGNSKIYISLRNSLSTFIDSADNKADTYQIKQGEKIFTDLNIKAVDYTFLKKYKNHLEKRTFNGQPLKETTLSNRFRTLCAVYNEAIKRGLVGKESYPFKDFLVSQFNVETKPRAISKLEIKALERLEISRESFLFDARNFFLFSYYGCGINFVDLAQLRWQNIDGNYIDYIRQKTGKTMRLEILSNLQDMLDYYEAFTGGHPTNYIFPILDRTKHVSHTQIDNRIDKVDKRVGKSLRQLCEKAGIQRITYYVARHTFANELKKAGVPISKIAELLGHDETQTKTYFRKFADEEKFGVLNNLY